MSRAHIIQEDGPRGRSVEEIAAAREVALARVRTMLADGPVTAHAICVELGMARGAGNRLLKHLAVDDEAHPTRQFDEKRRELWAAGPGEQGTMRPSLRKGVVRDVATVRAQQVGVQRDPLVAALFGPARGAAV
jgi:hypothetical protein